MNRYNSTERVRFSVEQRALAQQPQEQKEYVRRSQGRQPAERKAALVIMGAAIACVLIVAGAIWHTGRSTGSGLHASAGPGLPAALGPPAGAGQRPGAPAPGLGGNP